MTPQSGAFGWMGVPLKEGLQPEFDKLSYPRTFFSYITGMVLSLIPAILINSKYQILEKVKDEYKDSQWKLYGFGLILLCSTAVFIFSSDWGRLTYLFAFNIFLGLVVLKESLGCESKVPETSLQSPYHQVVYILLILLYASTWYLKHYVDGDHVALQQGLIFKIFDWL